MDEEKLLMSVAELKHVRDCLKFQLPFEEREIDWIVKKLNSPPSPAESGSDSSISMPQKTPQKVNSGIIEFESPLPLKKEMIPDISSTIQSSQQTSQTPKENIANALFK